MCASATVLSSPTPLAIAREPAIVLPLNALSQLIDNGIAVVVKVLASTELLDIVEIHWRGSGDDLIAGGDGELKSITANACRTCPD